MATSHKLFVLQSEQRICRVQEFWMKNYFNTIIHSVEQITTTNTEKVENLV